MRGKNKRTQAGEAVVLARRNFGEADRILVLFTADEGKKSVIAKGVRKIKSKKRGALEVFSRIKFSLAFGKSLHILTETEVIDQYLPVRKSLKKASVAYFLMETVGRLIREDEPHKDYYQYLVESLAALEKEKNLKAFRENFVKDSLTLLGFWPKGKKLVNPDEMLAEVTEREMVTVRVGKKMLS